MNSPSTIGIALFSTTTAIAIGSFLYHRRQNPPKAKRRVSFRLPTSDDAGGQEVPLLPTTEAKVIGLLFAASWCPDCTDVVPAIGKFAGEVDRTFLEIFYVASDRTEEEMEGFRPESIKPISFHMKDQREGLKRKFHTCAAKEMDGLGLNTRKNGLPTLLLLESSSGKILSETAHDDVMKGSLMKDTIAKWNSLL